MAEPQEIRKLHWRHQDPRLTSCDGPFLPYGYGRSYGDACLNHEGIILDIKGLNRFLAFDEQTGILRCEAGVALSEILEIFSPRGWFLPVIPGTQHVSVGGAIANDVHGKNHHVAGTFGCHVLGFELLRSNGEYVTCTPSTRGDLFRATIGGLGLTGIILWADIQLKPIQSAFIATERIRFANLDAFFSLSAESDEGFEYTVAWIDCLSGNRNLGRGSFIRGNHAADNGSLPDTTAPKPKIGVPFHAPSFLLNSWTIKLFNTLYFHSQPNRPVKALEQFTTFFFPLDGVHHWNRLYGSRGFLQYQCVIPPCDERDGIRELLNIIQHSKQGSFLAVLKRFGTIASPGLLSFPRPGTTLALDFPFLGDRTLSLLVKLDQIVRDSGGAVYPAKDARMSSSDFKAYFPRVHEFSTLKDPKFSSSFWRRVTAQTPITHCRLDQPNSVGSEIPEEQFAGSGQRA